MAKLHLTLIFCIAPIILYAQSSAYNVTERATKEDYIKIIFFNGNDSSTAYINPSLPTIRLDSIRVSAPWNLQDVINAIPESVMTSFTGKIKSKYFEKYKPKEFDGFKLDSSVYYSVLVKSSVGLGGERSFLELYRDGKYRLHIKYEAPITLTSYNVTTEILENIYDNRKFIYSYHDDYGTGKDLVEFSVKKNFGECPDVLDKYNSNGYHTGDGSPKTLGVILNETKISMLLLALEDYNEKCN